MSSFASAVPEPSVQKELKYENDKEDLEDVLCT